MAESVAGRLRDRVARGGDGHPRNPFVSERATRVIEPTRLATVAEVRSHRDANQN